jgi:tetratricopeptide (TPR) repeat protein
MDNRLLFAARWIGWLPLVALCCAWHAPAHAAIEAIGPGLEPFSLSATELLGAAELPAPREKYASTILLDAVRYEFDERQCVRVTLHRIYRIDTTAAIDRHGQVETSWEPRRQERPTIRARVVTPDGREHPFDTATLDDDALPDADMRIFNDLRLLRGPLPAIGVGSVVELEIVTNDLEAPFSSGRTFARYLGVEGPVEQTVITVIAPASVPLRHATRRLEEGRISERTVDGRRQLTLTQGPIAIDFDRVYEESAGEQPLWPQFLFATGESWAAVEADYEALAASAIRPEEVRALLPRPLPANRDELIAALLEKLHDRVRYTAVLFGQGKIVPNPPAVTLERRFGDCKDKSVVLASMLRAAGIPALLALVNADLGVDLDPTLPGIGAFNHMIVHVPGESPLWLDATAEHLRVGELPFEDTSRLALVIGGEGEPLVRTPAAHPEANFVQETLEVRLAEYGAAALSVSGRSRGSAATYLRAAIRDTAKSATRDRDEFLSSAYSAESVSRVEASDEPVSGMLRYQLELANYSLATTDFGEAFTTLPIESLFAGFPYGLRSPRGDTEADEEEPPAPRTLDWVFEPFIMEHVIRFIPPDGFQLRALPPDQELGFGPAVLTQQFEAAQDGVVTARFRISSGRGRYTPDEGRNFQQEYLTQSSRLTVELRFDHEATAQIAAGDEREGLARHAEFVATHPSKAIHHMRASRDLVALGLVDEARDEARKAAQLEPKNPRAFSNLGTILEFGELGKRFSAGMDRAGALRAHREAIRLDPKDKWLLSSVAYLSEVNDEGQRYGRGADLATAIATYRELLDEYPNWRDGQALLVQALWQDGQFEEIEPVAARIPDVRYTATLRFAARAKVKGVDMALRENAGRGDASSRRMPIQGAIPMLWMQRDYALARELIEKSGAERWMDPRDGVGQMLRKTVPNESLPAPARTAAGAADAFMRIVMRTRGETGDLRPLLSQRLADWGYAEQVLKQFDWSRYARIGGLRQFVTQYSDVFNDLVLSNLEYEELDAAGEARRVLVGMGNLPAQTLYVVPESDGWRILTLETYLAPVGREALARLDAGDANTARAWLELVREVLGRGAAGESDLPRRFAAALPREAPETDLAGMRLAAHMILFANSEAGATLAEVEAASRSAETDAQRALWETLIYMAAELEGNRPAMTSSADRIVAANRDTDPFIFRGRAYLQLGQWQEAERIGREWRAKDPTNDMARNFLLAALNGQSRYHEGLELLAPTVRRRQANADQLNAYAWQALLADEIDDSAIEAAENAFKQQSRRDFASGHTLACVYAASGRIAESRKVLLEMSEQMPDFNVQSGDVWLIRGLMAEELGRTKLAAEAYRLADEPTWPDPSSSFAVAAARLSQLEP